MGEAKKRDVRPTIVAYRGTEELAEWFHRLTETVGIPGTNIIDLALREFAERRSFAPMPSRQARHRAS